MKIAIVTDQLLYRDESTEILDLLCEVFPEAHLYTYAHQPGKVLGHVELRKVYSSYLSHFCKDRDSFHQYQFLIPTLGKNFSLKEKVDLVMSFSQGFAHGFYTPPGVKHISYVYQFEPYLGQTAMSDKKFFGRLFSAFIKKWQWKTLEQPDVVLTSSENLKANLNLDARYIKNKVLYPFFPYKDFNLGPAAESTILEYYLIHVDQVPLNRVEKLGEIFFQLQIPVKFIGEDHHLAPLKEKWKDKSAVQCEFLGKRCNGDLALYLHGCKATLDCGVQAFPYFALSSLASGRPVLFYDSERRREFFTAEDGFFWNEQTDFKQMLLKMETEFSWFEGKKLRRKALTFHDYTFRQELKKVVEEMFIAPKTVNH